MKSYLLKTEVWLPQPRDVVFDFFKRAENLQRITPPWLHFEILSDLPVRMAEGTLIVYRLRLYGVPIQWQAQIQRWQPPHHFTDVQISGPYRVWEHTHTFETYDAGTWMRDHVRYLPRGGVFASPVNHLFVRRQVQKIFEFRKRQILKIFGEGVQSSVD